MPNQIDIRPAYQIFPHGVTMQDGNMFAVFKLVLSPKNLKDIKVVTYDQWIKFISDSNGYWKYDKSQIKNGLLTFKQVKPEDANIIFNIRGKKKNENTDYKYTDFGRTYIPGIKKNVWDFLNDDIDFIVKKIDTGTKTMQFSDAENSANNINTVLSNAHGYGGAHNKRIADKVEKLKKLSIEVNGELGSRNSDRYDFLSILGSIMDEPLVAEHKMGLVREFSINITDLIDSEGAIDYNIEIEGLKEDIKEKNYRLRNKNGKYYNGNKDICLVAKQKPGFESAEIRYTDPYKEKNITQEDKQNNVHPDGIYLLVKYYEEAGKMIDPFGQENMAGLFGFNVIIRETKEDKRFWSLSFHQKHINLKLQADIKVLTSGTLTPRSELLTSDKTGFRNSILFAWRGDNLLVSRTPEIVKADDKITWIKNEKGANTEETYGMALTETEMHEEDKYIAKKIFSTDESLVTGTMPQLISGKNYKIYIRTTSPLHYCIPSSEELEKNKREGEDISKILTIEDVADEKNMSICDADFNVNDISILPIKSTSIIGTKNYSKDHEYVDNESHIVLDILHGEKAEKRYIFPPQIKWEDFKFLGYLSNYRIKKEGEERLQREEYILRCIRLESRITEKIPSSSIIRTGISYLADPRCVAIYIVGADLRTINKLPNSKTGKFYWLDKYPFFSDLKSFELKAENTPYGSNILLNNEPLFKNVEDGIYNFKVYAVDEDFLRYNADARYIILSKYNSVPLRISILNHPQNINLKKNTLVSTKAERILPSKINQSQVQLYGYWLHTISTSKNSDTWKSIKYLEENTVFKLAHSGFDALHHEYVKNTKNITHQLLKNEYPYEMFLSKEGSINAQEGLKTDILPFFLAEVGISSNAHKWLKDINQEEFFKLRLNEDQSLVCKIDKLNNSPRLILQLTGEINADGTEAPPTIYVAQNFRIQIFYDHVSNSNTAYRYILKINDFAPLLLKKFLNSDMSIADFEVPDSVLSCIQNNAAEIKVVRSDKFQVISDMKSPYYLRKKIRLFASSPFQAYYPKETFEFPLGTLGPILDLEIPNNVKPTAPKIDAKILLKHITPEKWSVYNEKQNATEQIVQLVINDDFMLEGPNRIGIVLSKTKKDGTIVDADDTVSEIGEDITKITKDNWKGKKLKDLISLSEQPNVLSKYYPQKQTKYYLINDHVYEVLEAVPYYNSELKNWQVLIPLKFFEKSEVIFIKFVTIKIAKGHSLKLQNEDLPNSASNYYTDLEQTNISNFSNPAQLPIYNRKAILLTKDSCNTSYTINIKSTSSYENKLYFLMMFKSTPANVVLNYYPQSGDKFPDLVEFTSIDDKTKGKILSFDGKKEIHVSYEMCVSIMVLEFETHKNFDMKNLEPFIVDTDKPSLFVSVNPLFDVPGLRLINAEEFIP